MTPETVNQAPVKRAARRRSIDYGSEDKPSSIKKQRLILALMLDGSLTVREIADLVGISRQLTLYHLKKLAYRELVAMTLEPAGNGKLRFRNRLRLRYRQAPAPLVAAGASSAPKAASSASSFAILSFSSALRSSFA
jgi:DNA-binding transcriptional ArsR family regulator